jgi:hypothetical protein
MWTRNKNHKRLAKCACPWLGVMPKKWKKNHKNEISSLISFWLGYTARPSKPPTKAIIKFESERIDHFAEEDLLFTHTLGKKKKKKKKKKSTSSFFFLPNWIFHLFSTPNNTLLFTRSSKKKKKKIFFTWSNCLLDPRLAELSTLIAYLPIILYGISLPHLSTPRFLSPSTAVCPLASDCLISVPRRSFLACQLRTHRLT